MATKILLVEDSVNDAAIISREIRKEMPEVQTSIVSNKQSLVAALEQAQPPDLVLLDYNLGRFSGDEVLEIMREKAPQIPSIIVSGSVGEEKIADAFRRGAVDFINKDRRARLPQAVRNAIKAAEKAKEAEALMLQTIREQRVQSVGETALAYAHDFNGILQVVYWGVEALRARAHPTDMSTLDAMESASKRGAEMTSQLLAYARGTNGAAHKKTSVAYLMTEIGRLARTFPPNIRFVSELIPGTSDVKCDATQIVQVLNNLCLNAQQAMPQGGEIRVKAQNISNPPNLQRPCVCISVRDTCKGGIPDAIMESIWKPFFTTKGSNGTGLGLPTVKRIIEAHHGAIEIETGESGSSFSVYIPIAIPWIAVAAESSEGEFDGHGKCVLLVDDHASVRDLTAMILESENYKVLRAINGPEALSFFREGHQIDVLVTDIQMPIFDGCELLRNLRANGINIPAIYLSGYDAKQKYEPEANAVLQKPVTRQVLLKAIADVLSTEG